MSFNTTVLAGNRVLVTGDTKEEKCILNSTEWDAHKHNLAHVAAEAFFDAKMKEFYAPVIAAAEAAGDLLDATMPAYDDAFVIELEPEVEATPGSRGKQIYLGRDAAILRMIESGDTSRLIWVDSTIEITAAPKAVAPVVNDDEVLNADDLR